ncbi:beta-lactamase [Cadophora sp. DSE1049]|nr:beta-lactamase [Cadophora sp. DSE1049]
MSTKSVFWLASCTKLVTAVAAMQCVERGLLKLDDPVGSILPEYAHPKILTGYTGDNKPILTPAKQSITLRHLLTHSSGLSYDVFGPELREWARRTGRTVNQQSGTLEQEGLTYPLLFEPGFGWTYGAGLDWAGQMIERVSGYSSLDEYFRENIWKPLGLKHTTFEVSSNKILLDNLVGVTLRKADGSLIPGVHVPRDIAAEINAGGAGLYGTASDFVRLVAEIVNDGGILLKPETVQEMFRPQFDDDRYLLDALHKSVAGIGLNISPNFTDPKMKIQHGLSFLINMEPMATGRPAGAGQYGGAANTFWWADRNTGVAGVVMTQIMPYGDPKVMEVYRRLEECIYQLGQQN